MKTNSDKKENCPNLCGILYQKFLSRGVNGDIFFCENCLLVWSEATWQKKRVELTNIELEKQEKKTKKPTKKKSKPKGLF